MSDPAAEPPLPPWPEISDLGGIDAWIQKELERRGLWDEGVDTSSLSDGERRKYKARREEERRVRKRLRAHGWSAYRGANIVHLGPGVFYHDTADVDRYDVDEIDARRQRNEVPEIPNATALAKALEVSVGKLRWLAFHRDVDSGTHYHRWLVPKRDGGRRLISAPKPLLKQIQRYICRNITERLPVHGAAHGFMPGRSTVTNATAHAGAAVVIKFDLRDFYPTVTMPRAKGLFRKAGYGEQVATLLAMLCTEAPRERIKVDGKIKYVAIGPRSLPQGAPTSPSITNALCLRLDARLDGLARKLGFRYTRYADDLTFSWADRKTDAPVGKLMGGVGLIVSGEGFSLHTQKTRVMRSGRRQKVTGLVVNEASDAPAARLPRKALRRLRAAIHNRAHGKDAGPAQHTETLEQLEGLAAYVHMSDPQRGRAMLDRIASIGDTASS